MKSSKGWLGRTFLVAALLVAGPVWADEPAKSAESVYVQGKRLADEGQWEAALSLFKDAYAMDPSPKRAAHLGRAQVMTGRYAEGAANLERYLREEKNPPEDIRAAVEGMLRDAKTKVAAVTLKIDAQGAMLRIDKEEVSPDRWGLTQYLEPKIHVFELAKEGFVTTSKTFDLAAGQVAEVELQVGEAVVVVGPETPITKPGKPLVDKRVVIGGGVASGALLLLAGGLGIAANVKHKDAQAIALSPDYTNEEKRRSDFKAADSATANYGKAALVLLGLGVVGGVGTAIYGAMGGRATDAKGNAKMSWVAAPTVGGFVFRALW